MGRLHYSGDSECYLLESSPWALSLGEQARKGKAFIWLPAQSPDDPLPLPFRVDKQNIEHLKVSCRQQYRIYAGKVKENVPIFKEHVEVSHMAAVEEAEEKGYSDYTLSLPPEDPEAQERGEEEEEEEIKEPEDEDVAPVLDQSLLHLSKDPHCLPTSKARFSTGKEVWRPSSIDRRRVNDPSVISSESKGRKSL